MTAWVLFGVPLEYTKEDVIALMPAHVSWPVIPKRKPLRGKGKTHHWRVLSAAVPNLDFAQQGISIKDATLPGGLASITVSRQDSLPKAMPKPPKELRKPPKEDPNKMAKGGSAEPVRKKVIWPRDLAGASTDIIDVDTQAEVVTGGAVRSAASSSSASSSGSSAATAPGASPEPATSGESSPEEMATSAAAPPALFTPEQMRMMTDNTNQLKISLAGDLKTMLSEAIGDIKTSLMTEVGKQVKGLETKIAEVAAEKEPRSGSAALRDSDAAPLLLSHRLR